MSRNLFRRVSVCVLCMTCAGGALADGGNLGVSGGTNASAWNHATGSWLNVPNGGAYVNVLGSQGNLIAIGNAHSDAWSPATGWVPVQGAAVGAAVSAGNLLPLERFTRTRGTKTPAHGAQRREATAMEPVRAAISLSRLTTRRSFGITRLGPGPIRSLACITASPARAATSSRSGTTGPMPGVRRRALFV